ncbi:FeoB-associated Cys-rich membrane protein [Bacillus smithii]|uniref:FeoB-associated Cys-rich membrane protein n=1 Tax=Bacillus smithii TaxID=1479 RepID=UPI0030C91385
MIISSLIVAAAFGYAGYTLYRYIQRTKQGGYCAHCSLKDKCTTKCETVKKESISH